MCTGGTQKISCNLRYSVCPYEPIRILCTTGTQKISCDLCYSLCSYVSIIILCTGGTQKISCDLRYSSCPYMNPLQFLCTTGTQKNSCDLRYSLCPMNPLQFLCTGGTRKISCDLRYSSCPYMNPLQFLCTSGTQKVSCDLCYSLCPYESIIIFVYRWYTKSLMRLYTCSSCLNRFFEYIGTLPLSYMLLTLLRLITKKNFKSNSLVMKPVGPYRNIKHVALFSQVDTKSSNHFQLSGSLLQISSISLKL